MCPGSVLQSAPRVGVPRRRIGPGALAAAATRRRAGGLLQRASIARRVVQIAWLRDAKDLERKRRRGRLAWWLKGLLRR
jgi:hypothetical protein